MILLQGDDSPERRRQRLKKDLGLNDEAVEVIMQLLSEISTLQAQVREQQTSLECHQAEAVTRMARYRRVIYEASWEDL